MNSEDLYEGYSDVSSIDNFNEDTDEEMEKIAGKTFEPYQFEPVEAAIWTNLIMKMDHHQIKNYWRYCPRI